jgi:hypothetical protein
MLFDITYAEAISVFFAGGRGERGIFTLPKLPAHYIADLYLSKLKMEIRMRE